MAEGSLPALSERQYGGPWQEFRALVATWLMTAASFVHHRATMDIAHDLASVEAEARAGAEFEEACLSWDAHDHG